MSQDNIIIINYTSEYRADFEYLNRWWLEKWYKVEPIDKAYFADPEGKIIARGGHIFMALLEGKAVGTCALIPDGSSGFELAKMGVNPNVHGKGIGRKLVEAALAKARECEAKRVHLLSSGGLTTAHALYRKCGFRDIPLLPQAREIYQRAELAMELIFEPEYA